MSGRAFDTLVWLPLAVLHGVGMVDQMKVLPLTLSGNELFPKWLQAFAFSGVLGIPSLCAC